MWKKNKKELIIPLIFSMIGSILATLIILQTFYGDQYTYLPGWFPKWLKLILLPGYFIGLLSEFVGGNNWSLALAQFVGFLILFGVSFGLYQLSLKIYKIIIS